MDKIALLRTSFMQYLCALVILQLMVIMISSEFAVGGELLGEETQVLRHTEPLHLVSWSPDGRYLATTNSNGSHIYLWNVSAGTIIRQVDGVPRGIDQTLCFDVGSKLLIAPSTVAFANTANNTTLSLIAVDAKIPVNNIIDQYSPNGSNLAINFSLSLDGKYLAAILGAQSGMVTIYDTNSWQPLKHIGPYINLHGNSRGLNKVVIDSSRGILVLADVNGGIETWDISLNRRMGGFRAYNSGLWSMALNPLSGVLVTGGSSAVITEYVYKQGSPPRKVIRADEDGTLVRSWDPKSGQQLATYVGPGGDVSSLAVSANGRYVAAVELPHYIHLWDAETAQLLGSIDTGQSEVGGVAFSPDSRRIAYTVGSSVHIAQIKARN